MDNMIFNVRTFLCVRIQTGVGHTDNESAHHYIFDSEKLSQFVIVLRTGFEPLILGSRVDAPPIVKRVLSVILDILS